MRRTVKAWVVGYINGNNKVRPYTPWRLGGAWSAFDLLGDARAFRDRCESSEVVIVRGSLTYDNGRPAKRRKRGGK